MEIQVTEIQNRVLNIMKWFHQFCQDNQLTYYMIEGTMLGAARHQGFIPWDDDIDIGMPRNDYNVFLERAKSLCDGESQYIVESVLDGNDDFEYPYAKVYDTRTTLIENRRKRPKRGVFIDVFPLDGIGSSMEDAIKNFSPISLKLDLLAARSCAVRKGRSGLKNFAVSVVGHLPKWLINSKSLIRSINRLCVKRSFNECAYVGNLVGKWKKKELMPRSAYGNPVLYPFEDCLFYGVEHYDEYLTFLYSNWRQLPPPEKQRSEHDFLELDLNKPFRNE